jgi:hypothetical protein
MKGLHMVAFLLVVVGGLNWLLVGLFNWDIGALFGGMTAMIPRAIYVLVGLSAIVLLATHKRDCKGCSAPAAGGGM